MVRRSARGRLGHALPAVHFRRRAAGAEYRAVADGRGWLPGPILLILQYDADGQSVWQRIAFRREGGVWRLHSLLDSEIGVDLSVADGMAIRRVPADKGQTVAAASFPCTFDTNLRTMRLTDVPLMIP